MKIYKEDFTTYTFIEGTIFKSIDPYNPLYDAPPIVYKDFGKWGFMDIGGEIHIKNNIEYIELNSLYERIMWYLKNLIK
jgi:hypothetical protein